MPDATPLRMSITLAERSLEPDADPGVVHMEVTFYFDDGSVRTIEAQGHMVTQKIRVADEFDELLAADMREVWQRDYRRRQEAEAT